MTQFLVRQLIEVSCRWCYISQCGLSNEWVSDCCLTPTQQIFSNIMTVCLVKINIRENRRCNQLWTI